jgi:hypothetical protein
MMKQLSFTAIIQKFPMKSAWYYVDVPTEFLFGLQAGSYGFTKIKARINDLEWSTSLLPKGDGGYFIAIKKDIRTKLKIDLGDEIEVRFDYC